MSSVRDEIMAGVVEAYRVYSKKRRASTRWGMTSEQYLAANLARLTAHAELEGLCMHALGDEPDPDACTEMEELVYDLDACGGSHARIFEEIKDLIKAQSRKDSHSDSDSD